MMVLTRAQWGDRALRAHAFFPILLLLAPLATSAADDPLLVGWPNDGDVARYRRAEDGQVRNVTLAWSAAAVLDAWGRETRGAVASWEDGRGACAFLANTGTGPSARSDTLAVLDRELRYGLSVAPISSLAPASCVAGAVVGPDGVGIGVDGNARTRFGEWPVEACLFRHALQGAAISRGTDVAAFCNPLGARVLLGAFETRAGFSVVAVHLTRENGNATLWLADGIPYPIEAEFRDEASVATYHLIGLRLGDVPLTFEDPIPPDQRLAPLDPLLGPHDQGARLPLRLSDAARAATSDPTLLQLRSVLAQADAALASATMTARGPVDAPSAEWILRYAAPNGGSAVVSCMGALGVARCSAGASESTPEPPDDFGAASLPAQSVGFSDAFARWEALDANASSSPVSVASYRAWSDEEEDASILVGTSRQGTSTAPATHRSESRASVEPATGRSIEAVQGYHAPFEVDGVPTSVPLPGFVEAQNPSSPRLAPPTRAAIGASVAFLGIILLVGLFFKGPLGALFTRLRGADVLADASRQRILDVVRGDPGIHAAGILQRVGKEGGVGEYHLGVLEREGFLTSVDTPGSRRYFATGTFTHADMQARAILREGQADRVFRIIAENPGINLTELAARAGLSLAYTSRTVKRLHVAGLVERAQVGRDLTLRAKS